MVDRINFELLDIDICVKGSGKMSKRCLIINGALAIGLIAYTNMSMAAYISDSTGVDGAFNPTTSQAVQLPSNGVFNYTSVNIPSGVTITYKKNASNTPVTIFASGDVTIAGVIDVSATAPLDAGDIGSPGLAGPGGYNGGRGGQAGGDSSNWIDGLTGFTIGRAGVGPGGGMPGPFLRSGVYSGPSVASGGGGAFGTAPAAPANVCPTTPGVVYGNLTLLPLIGGSGGGGGAGGSVFPGLGGGGGGGAILIAASGTINVTGSILANGGATLRSNNNGRGGLGGGGSGGAIRLIASTISGNGTINAIGGVSGYDLANQTLGTAYYVCSGYSNGASEGGFGRIRLESETLSRTVATSPFYVGSPPSIISIPGLPVLSIASIAGMAVTNTPTGAGDIRLPTNASNPVTVVLVTKGVTVGSSIKLTLLPATGVPVNVTSGPTTGTVDNATASVSLDIPGGSSSLQASVTYTVLASAGDAMSTYAQGERVEKVRLSSVMGGPSTATLITISGKEFTVPASSLVGIS